MVNECLSAIEEGKLDAALNAINEAERSGGDIEIFLNLLLHKIRSILLLRFAHEIKNTIEEQFGESDLKLLETISAKKDSNINSALLRGLLEASISMKFSAIPSLPLELALIAHLHDLE